MNLQYVTLNQQLLQILNIIEYGICLFESIENDPIAYEYALNNINADISYKTLLCKYFNKIGQTYKLKLMMKKKLKNFNGLINTLSLNLPKIDSSNQNFFRKTSAPLNKTTHSLTLSFYYC